MKKALVIALTLLMTVAFSSTAFAATVTEGWTTRDNNTPIEPVGKTITIPDTAIGGASTYAIRGDAIDGTKTYEAIVDLSKEYQHGELFCISLGFGINADTYNTEFSVCTQKSGDDFIVSAGVAGAESITVTEPGIYTYQWTVSKSADKISASFEIAELGQTLEFTDEGELAKLQDSKVVRYLWAFGGGADPSSYQLDRDLVLYTAKPEIQGVSVVDGTDGYTPVEIPQVGQKLTANVTVDEGTVGSYPVDENISYVWSYEDSDTVLGTEPVYTVTEDNLGKKIVLTVSGGNHGYAGIASWSATDVVGAEPGEEPTEPGTDDPTTGDGQDGTAAGNTDKGNGQPKTGDSSNVLPFVALLTLAAAAGTAVAVKRRTNQ